MVGSGMQQARKALAEETVEVVRNHEDGTSLSDGSEGSKGDGNVAREWTPRPMSTEGQRQNPEEVTDVQFAARPSTAAA